MQSRHFLVVAAIALCMAVAASAADCYAIETDYKYNIPMGVFGTFGGCVKGNTASDGKFCETKTDGTRTEGNYASLSACCTALEPRATGPDPHNGQARPEQKDVKNVCNSYKKKATGAASEKASAPAPAPASGTPRQYMVFKGYDLPALLDVPSRSGPFTKVCGGLEAVAKACTSSPCAAFTFGGDKDCGFLKARYFDFNQKPPVLMLQSNSKGWNAYADVGTVPKALGGALDCSDASKGYLACQVKGNVPKPEPALSA